MIPPDVTQQLRQAGSAGSLADAAAFLRRRVCPDGAVDGPDGDFDLAERQWADLLEWAGAQGKILPLGWPAPDREGGREHDVTVDEASGRWIKYTKPSASGFTVSWSESGQPYLHHAHPLDYRQRLLWQNEVLGDDLHLVGLWQEQPHRWRIVTTQPGLQGSRVTLADLSAAFVATGFVLLPWRGLGYENSLSFRFGSFDLWDVHPANVLLSPEGLPLPLDVIVTRSPCRRFPSALRSLSLTVAMLDTDTKRRIDTARDILVGKVPDPKSQVEQITIALIYKFMDDMDAESEELGGKRKFFTGAYARYGWAKLMAPSLGGHEMLGLHGEGMAKMPENPGFPPLSSRTPASLTATRSVTLLVTPETLPPLKRIPR